MATTQAYGMKTSVISDGAKRYLPEALVTFHTENACYQASGVAGSTGSPDPSYQLISLSTQKSLRSPAGGFTIQLAGEEWVYRLKSNDMVTIAIGNLGDKKSTIMVGLIDRVERRRAIDATGKPQVLSMVTGRDFGKALLKANLKTYGALDKADVNKKELSKDEVSKEVTPQAKQDNMFLYKKNSFSTYIAAWTAAGTKLTGNAHYLCDAMLRMVFQKVYDVKWWVYDTSKSMQASKDTSEVKAEKKQASVGQIVRYVFNCGDIIIPFRLTMEGLSGVFWNLIEAFCIKPFYELTIDTRASADVDAGKVASLSGAEVSDESKSKLDKSPYPYPGVRFGEDRSVVILSLRKTPFDKAEWGALASHEVKKVDVVREDLEQSDDSHFNLFFVGSSAVPTATSAFDGQKVTNPVKYDEKAIGRYGLQPLEVNMNAIYVDRADTKAKGTLSLLCGNLAETLQKWFKSNNDYWHGSLEIRGKGAPKVGDVLLYKDCDITAGIGSDSPVDFYIEGVEQNFVTFMNWRTKLTVTRGQLASKRFS